MHWTERAKAVVRIGKELRNRGWTLHGFTEDKSDPRTDTYSPANWDGVATHEELGNTVVCVDVGHNAFSGDDGWPEYQATPHRKTWHVERDGQILKAGVGLGPCAKTVGWEAEVEKVVRHIEIVAYGSGRKTAASSGTSTDTGDYTVTIEHDRDWTWVFFSDKPLANVRDQLSNMGARWSKKREGWYFRRDVPDDELAWLSLTDDGDVAEAEVQMTPRPQSPGKGDAHDYVPDWMTIPTLYETEKDDDPLAIIKLFTPLSDWTWYITEYDSQGKRAFGLVVRADPAMTELGYFSIAEMEEMIGPAGMPMVERDLWWKPTPITDVPGYQAKWGKYGGPYRPTPALEKKEDTESVEEIKAREGEPCTVVTDENDEITHIITPAWLYRQWHTLLGERGEVDDADADTFARDMFLEGMNAFSASSSEFRRFCRCAIEGALKGDECPAWAWKEAYQGGGDFAPPLCWKTYIGTKQTEPQFNIGDKVRFSWKDESESHSVNIREWREFDSRWHYKVRGKWWPEHDLVAAESAHKSDHQPSPEMETEDTQAHANDAEKSATEPETPTLPEGWAIEDIQALLKALDEEGPILVSDSNLGIPTIHDPDFRDNGDGKVRHLGYGMFELQTQDYTLRFDAGGAMKRTPSNKSWTRLRVVEGEYDYPFEDVYLTLEHYLYATPDEDTTEETEKAEQIAGEASTDVHLAAYKDGDQVWWEDNGNVQTGVVNFTDSANGKVVVKCDDCLAVAGGVPIGRIKHFAPNDLNPGPLPAIERQRRLRLHLAEVYDLEIGETVWWRNPAGNIEVATIESCYYSGGLKKHPCIGLRRHGGVVTSDGRSVSIETDDVGFILDEFKALAPQSGVPDEAIIIEPGDTVVIASDYSVPGRHVISPKRNTCRANRKVTAGDTFKLLRFFKSTGGATHGSIYAAVENDQGYELYIPIYKIALTDDQEVDAEEAEVVEDAAKVETTETAEADETTEDDEANLRNKRKLPNDVPLFIKIDLGRDYGWAEAEVTKVKGRWLHYTLRNGNEKRGNGKVQLIGRDILWQPSAVPADEATAIAGGAQ